MAKMAVFSIPRYVVGERNVTNFTTCLKDVSHHVYVSLSLFSLCLSFALSHILKSNRSS